MHTLKSANWGAAATGPANYWRQLLFNPLLRTLGLAFGAAQCAIGAQCTWPLASRRWPTAVSPLRPLQLAITAALQTLSSARPKALHSVQVATLAKKVFFSLP